MRIFISVFLLLFFFGVQAQVAINTDDTSPDNSALLEVKSTTKVLMAPRMTVVKRNAIMNPATGINDLSDQWY